MMHEREKSDPAIVAVKPTNKAERSAAEPVERRAGANGNADQHNTCRAQYRVSVSQALERIRQVRRHSLEVGAVCGKAARTVLCGGRSAMSVPTAIVARAPRNDGVDGADRTLSRPAAALTPSENSAPPPPHPGHTEKTAYPRCAARSARETSRSWTAGAGGSR